MADAMIRERRVLRRKWASELPGKDDKKVNRRIARRRLAVADAREESHRAAQDMADQMSELAIVEDREIREYMATLDDDGYWDYD